MRLARRTQLQSFLGVRARGRRGELHQQAGDLAHWQAVLHMVAIDGALRHAALDRFGRVLYHGHTSALGDMHEPGGAVLQQAREYHADHAWAIERGCRVEQHVDARAIIPLLGRGQHPHAAALDGQLVIRDGDIDRACPQKEYMRKNSINYRIL